MLQPHLPTLFQRPDRLEDPLYVVTTVFNAARYRARWELAEDFIRWVARYPAAILYVVEVAFGDRAFAVTESGNPRHLQLRTRSELWLKENALNLGVQRLPPDWKYVCWLDADIKFVRDDWADEARHLLQHYSVIQMWSEADDLDGDHQVLHHWRSLAWCHVTGQPTRPSSTYYYPGFGRKGAVYPHAGYAWAARREAWEALGGLIDFAACGSADWHQGHALLDQVHLTLDPKYHPRYKALFLEWQARARRSIRRNVGVMPGLVLHAWHGPKVARQYQTRNSILTRHQFNPDTDLKRDWQGLWSLTGRSIGLRDELRKYFASRDEDARS